MDEIQNDEDINSSFIGRHRFLFLIISAIIISGVLVSISIMMYNSSGAAQLDLSRPGYVNVRAKTVDSTSDFKNYPDSGAMSQSAIDEFKALYNDQAQKTKAANAFKSDPLNPDSLGINSEIE